MAAKDSSRIATHVRFNEITYRRLCLIAEEECRSINAQIEYFVKKCVDEYLSDHPLLERFGSSEIEELD